MFANSHVDMACIDTTKKDYGPVLSRFVSTSINEYLSEEDMTELRHAYRANRHEFTENQAVIRLNQKLQEGHSFDGKTIGLNLRESGIDEWKGDMSISLDGIPLENSGFGTQNMFKSEIFLLQNTDVDILIIEEPENNLSYSNMSILISKLSDSNGKQLFISTHSSFVANKLGLQCLHLVANARTTPFKSLSSDTYNYFLKLPGYNTLRILLANKAILVEGPADELILQRAYIDTGGGGHESGCGAAPPVSAPAGACAAPFPNSPWRTMRKFMSSTCAFSRGCGRVRQRKRHHRRAGALRRAELCEGYKSALLTETARSLRGAGQKADGQRAVGFCPFCRLCAGEAGDLLRKTERRKNLQKGLDNGSARAIIRYNKLKQ